MNFISQVSDHFHTFYQGDRSYYHAPQVNLEAEMQTYSFTQRYPEVAGRMTQIFEETLPFSEENFLGEGFEEELIPFKFTVGDALVDPISTEMMRDELIEKNFTIYSGSHTETSIVLEHATTPGWLIKQNFVSRWGDDERKIMRVVYSNNLPFWFFPFNRKSFSGTTKFVYAPNEALNPLRVVVMKRARTCIKHFNLDRISACKEYLLRIPHTPDNASLRDKYVVISKKVPILSEEASLQRYMDLARNAPEELKDILRQVCLVIKHTHLTDMHLHNIRFAADGTNKVYLFDGEPVGGLSDVSQVDMKNAYKGLDFALFPVLGMRFLQEQTARLLRNHHFSEVDIARFQGILDSVINPAAESIINDRRWYYFKIISSLLCPLIPLIVITQGVVKTILNHFQPPPYAVTQFA